MMMMVPAWLYIYILVSLVQGDFDDVSGSEAHGVRYGCMGTMILVIKRNSLFLPNRVKCEGMSFTLAILETRLQKN
jgi:hypothetical protein